eukprot:TRINITY_DN112023_c0_g1_i1.p1 TRINITY_DN112023_c0_g1~~TRINITY_DN112023_c0_g1_i1.p1  ORF type:complete len:247 (-),score=39.05 TRINITY_DN112023_c0_g1_i1:35-736(-)
MAASGYSQSVPAPKVASGYGEGLTSYCVAQGFCFFKPSNDPSSSTIIKAKRPAGSLIHTTGKTWRGPAGGVWVEVDSFVMPDLPEGVGWALVDGPGFGLRGPALIDPGLLDKDYQQINVRFSTSTPIFSCVIGKQKTVGDLVHEVCSRLGLKRVEVVLTKALPKDAPDGSGQLPVDYTVPEDMLNQSLQTIDSAKISQDLNLIYVGHDLDKIDMLNSLAGAPLAKVGSAREDR